MGEYINKKSEMRFQSIDSLNSVINVINEAGEAVKDKKRTIAKSAIPEALGGALGAGAGGAIAFAALYFAGPVGLGGAGIMGGLAALGGGALAAGGAGILGGLAVMAAPVALLAGGGVGLAAHFKHKKLREAKEMCYKEAVAKQNAIIRALREESRADKERIDYLTSLNTLLSAAVRDLKHDLGYI